MPYVSLAEQQQQFLGVKKTTKPSMPTSGYTPLAQAQQQFLKAKTTIKMPQAKQVAKSVVKAPITTNPTQQQPNPITHAIGQVARTVVGGIKNLPEAHFADNAKNYKAFGFAAPVAQFGAGLVQGLINTPAQAFKGSVSIGEHARDHTASPKQVAGDLAAAAQLPLLFIGGGEAIGAAEQTGKQAIKQVAKSAIKFGGAFGALAGLQSGKDIKNNKDYGINLLENTGIGILTAGTLEGLTRVAVPLIKGASSKLGAAFVKIVDKKPVIEHVQFDPKIAQNIVLTHPEIAKSTAGKELLKQSVAAEQQGMHVVIQSAKDGAFTLPDGKKVNISTAPIYEPQAEPKTPVDLKIKQAEHLAPEDRTIEKNFTEYVQNNYDEAKQRYNELPDTEGGKILNTDTVRELDSNYANDRSKSAAVHEPASAFTKKLYEDKLKELDPNGNNSVLFTAGGTGAGKSTAIKNVPAIKALADNAQIIYDTNMSGFNSSVSKIEQALKAEKKVALVYVYREPVEALINGALPRAERMALEKGSGRTVPLNEHLKTHVESTETLIKLAEKYKDNPHVGIEVIDNSHGKNGAVLSKLDLLKEINYNKEELGQKLTSALNQEYERNKISDKTYKGFSESKPETASKNVEGDSTRNGTSNDKKPEPTDSTRTETAKPTVEDYANPLGKGKLKNSRFFERLKESFGEDIPESVSKENPQYKTLDLEKSAFQAVKIATETPEQALRIADGLEAAPEGTTKTQLQKTIIAIAREKGDWETFNKYAVKTSLEKTRLGQEIVSLRGINNDHNPLAYVDHLVKTQKERIVKIWDKTLLENYQIAKDASVETKFKVIVEKQTEKLRSELRTKRAKMQSAQEIINSLICK